MGGQIGGQTSTERTSDVTTYLHRCEDCGAAFEASKPKSERLCCRTPGCAGRPKRVPGVVLYRWEPDAGAGDETRC